MRRFIILLILLALPITACSLQVQTFPEGGVQTEIPESTPTPATGTTTGTDAPAATNAVEGPNIDYKGIRFTLDPALGSRLYVYDETMTLEGATAHFTRFALAPEEYCQTWCLMVYPVQEFEQAAFGGFVFPPAGYRGGAAVVFNAQEKTLAFQNGSGDRALQTFGQNGYGVSNESLNYAFRGYTTDRQSAVYVQIPVRAASLPEAAPTISTDVQEILTYNEQAAGTMNALAPGDFTPNLDLLDGLVASIQVGTP